jgi:hypothetical protein
VCVHEHTHRVLKNLNSDFSEIAVIMYSPETKPDKAIFLFFANSNQCVTHLTTLKEKGLCWATLPVCNEVRWKMSF